MSMNDEASLEEVTKQRDELLSVLYDIAYPIGKLTRDAEAEGCKLNGYASELSNDPIWLKSLATDALAKYR